MWVGLATAFIFLLTGGLIAGWGTFHAIGRRRIRQWPRAKGKMLEAKLDSGGSLTQDDEGELVESTWYEIRFRYSYEVNGTKYVGTAYGPTPFRTSSGKAADAMRKKYAVGNEVDVLYDAANPKTAYLESPVSGGAVFLIIFGSVFLVAALGTVAIVLASA